MDYCNKYNVMCESANTFGCKLTACSKYSLKNQIIYSGELNAIIFPQTIGDITFYSSEELIKWVEEQQKMNKDPDYGRGTWA